MPLFRSLLFDENIDPTTLPELTTPEGDFELLSEEDLEERFNQKEDEPHEKKE